METRCPRKERPGLSLKTWQSVQSGLIEENDTEPSMKSGELFDRQPPNPFLNPDLVTDCDFQSTTHSVEIQTDLLRQLMSKEVDAQIQKKCNVGEELLFVNTENVQKEEYETMAQVLEEKLNEVKQSFENKLLEADKKKLHLESTVKQLKIQRQKDRDEIERLRNYCNYLYFEAERAKYFLQEKELLEKNQPVECDCPRLCGERKTLKLKVTEIKSHEDSLNLMLEPKRNDHKKVQLKMKEEIDCLQADQQVNELRSVNVETVQQRLKEYRLEIPPIFTSDPLIAKLERQTIELVKDALAEKSKTFAKCHERFANSSVKVECVAVTPTSNASPGKGEIENVGTSWMSTIDIKKWLHNALNPFDESSMITKESTNYCGGVQKISEAVV